MKVKLIGKNGAAAAAIHNVVILVAGLLLFWTAGARAQYSVGQRVWSGLPEGATYYSMANDGTNGPPFPFCPYDPTEVPVFAVDSAGTRFIFDDTGLMAEESLGGFSSNVPEFPPDDGGDGGGGGGGGGGPYGPLYGTNDLLLEVLSVT